LYVSVGSAIASFSIGTEIDWVAPLMLFAGKVSVPLVVV